MKTQQKRGPKGGGSIRKRPDNKWEGRVTVGRDPGTGKQVQKTIRGDTQKEVRIAMQRIIQAVDEGTYSAPVHLTVVQWLDTWLNEYKSDVKHTSRVDYEQRIRVHIVPALGATRLSALTPVAVQKFYNSLQRKQPPLSPKSVKNVHGVLHEALAQAVRLGYIRSNPADGCVLPRIEKADIQPLDAPQISAFLIAIEGDPFESLFKVDLFTGMREGEILGLQWDRVDFEHGTIFIDRQLARPRAKGDQYHFAPLKNDRPRLIRPAPYVMDVLSRQRREQAEIRLKAGSLWNDEGFPDLVFTNEMGHHLYSETVLRHYRRILDKAGIPPKRFHDLRHTYAVTSLYAGDDIKTVQENLGHSTAAFTLDVYGHVTDAMRKASADRMEAFINDLK